MISKKLAKALEARDIMVGSELDSIRLSRLFNSALESKGDMLAKILSVPLQDIPKYLVGDYYQTSETFKVDGITDMQSCYFVDWFEGLARIVLQARLEIEE